MLCILYVLMASFIDMLGILKLNIRHLFLGYGRPLRVFCNHMERIFPVVCHVTAIKRQLVKHNIHMYNLNPLSFLSDYISEFPVFFCIRRFILPDIELA
jgi:hypothetical protein